MKFSDAILSGLPAICREHKVNELYLFGSLATGTPTPQSDVDLLVRFDPMDLYFYFDNYLGLKEQLEVLFNRPVDLVEDQAIRNPVFRKVVDRDKVLVYRPLDC
ncbi:MAG: nucleotidyltransferase family protein [Bacteroidota bacterium]